MAIHGIILSAGASTRMGHHKALLPVAGVPLLRRHTLSMLPYVDGVTVVLGARSAEVAAVLPAGVRIVHNPTWATTGPRESLLAALAGLRGEDWSLITPVDVPPAPPTVLSALLSAGAPCIASHCGQDGHPVLLSVQSAVAGLRHGTLRRATASAIRVDVDWPDAIRNLNTPADWASWTGHRP